MTVRVEVERQRLRGQEDAERAEVLHRDAHGACPLVHRVGAGDQLDVAALVAREHLHVVRVAGVVRRVERQRDGRLRSVRELLALGAEEDRRAGGVCRRVVQGRRSPDDEHRGLVYGAGRHDETRAVDLGGGGPCGLDDAARRTDHRADRDLLSRTGPMTASVRSTFALFGFGGLMTTAPFTAPAAPSLRRRTSTRPNTSVANFFTL